MSEYMNVWIWSTASSHWTTLVGSIWYHHPTGKEQFFHWPSTLLIFKAPICVKCDPKGAGWKGPVGTGHHLQKRKATGKLLTERQRQQRYPHRAARPSQRFSVSPTVHRGPEPAGWGFSAQKENPGGFREGGGGLGSAGDDSTCPGQQGEPHLWAQTTLSKEPGLSYFTSLNLSVPHVQDGLIIPMVSLQPSHE